MDIWTPFNQWPTRLTSTNTLGHPKMFMMSSGQMNWATSVYPSDSFSRFHWFYWAMIILNSSLEAYLNSLNGFLNFPSIGPSHSLYTVFHLLVHRASGSSALSRCFDDNLGHIILYLTEFMRGNSSLILLNPTRCDFTSYSIHIPRSFWCRRIKQF